MRSFPTRVALTAALASIGALAAPAIANATVTPVVAANTLTVTSDQAPDTIALSVVNGHVAVGATETTLVADDNADIVVNAGDGADTVDASALTDKTKYKSLIVNGGEGDDLITGGADIDTLNGDNGADRVVGGKENDVLNGGEGNDTLVWNNGDNTDTDTGGNGIDEVEVNGAPTAGDVFTAQPGALPGAVRFDRTNLVTFHIDLTAERLTVNGLGGNDVFTPDALAPTGLSPLTSMTLNGGTGNDTFTGGDGADQINGGAGNDVLTGGPGPDAIRGGDDDDIIDGEEGDDRIIGDRGLDQQIGGEGDDVLVWNNGDGTDSSTGDAGFDRVEVNGSPTAGDAFKLGPNGATDKFERTNLVAFSISIDKASTEALSVNGGGGNDTFSVTPGIAPALLVAADGDAGNDVLAGGDETDSFLGGSGDDMLAGGRGSDLLDGEEGNDALFARDLTGDLVRGGAGTDSAQTDAITVDAYSGIEALDATPLPAPDPGPTPDRVALLPKVGKAKVVRSHGRLIAKLPLSCPAAEAGGCRTTVTLETAKAVKLAGIRAVAVLGSKSVRLRGGQRATLSIRLVRGAEALAKHGKIATRARVATSDASGNHAARSVSVSLRTPRR